jgi:hypothetical protein
MSEADANKAIGWINSHGTVQDLRNELTYIVGNKEQYLANNPQAASYIKVAMGLATLGAEIDRPYLGGMGPVAEETRKRLDAILDGLKKAPNVAVLKSGLQSLKGYVNEIIDTALPSAIMNDKSMQAQRAKSLADNEKFRHETGVDIRGNGVDPAKISQPVFRSDDADLKKHITEQIANGSLKSGDIIHIKNPDGTIAEHKVK